MTKGVVYEESEASDERIALDRIDDSGIEGFLVEGINKRLKRKLRPNLEQDTILNKLCLAGINSYNANRFTDRDKFKKEREWLDVSLRESGSKNRMFLAYAFEVDLVDYSPLLRYHYSKKETGSPLDLYSGSKSIKKDTSVTHMPIMMKTEKQLYSLVSSKLRSKGFDHYLFKKNFSAIGLALRLNKDSIGRKKRPQMLLMLMVAGKQNQKVRERPNPLLEKAEAIKSGKIKIED